MLVQGTAVSQTVREGASQKGEAYRLAVLNVLDKSLNDVVECTKFLKPGEASPFAEVKDGSQVSIAAKRITVYRFRVQAEAA